MKAIQFLTALLLLVMVISCHEESVFTSVQEIPDIQIELDESIAGKKAPKVDLCHYDSENITWHVINVNANAVQAHLNHGDVLLVDGDGDGWVELENKCVPGGDCDDSDASVFPGAEEICDDGVDNDCNGLIDCEDSACEEAEVCVTCCFDDVLDHYTGQYAFVYYSQNPNRPVLWPQNRAYGVGIFPLGFTSPNPQCGYSDPVTGEVYFVDITAEEAEDCAEILVQIATELGLVNQSGNSQIPLSGTNVFGIN